ncbi:MAG: hypothetical protein RRY26_05425 [Cellulosilyticaceae bacterium]
MCIIYNEIKDKIRLKQSILATLETPLKDSPYTRSVGNLERKIEDLRKEIKELKEMLDRMNKI